ncbi:DUF6545 domain-containing protein [Pseudonocardia sp. ICBG1142]|uniref:DUF6545 domain-containing protein n=1 Tax=Pseudonocardia sp. ICBG1142 TaxID=2846760 RepID=UPI0035A8F71E
MAAMSAISLTRQILYIVYPGSRWPAMRDWYNTARLSGQIILASAFAIIPIVTSCRRLQASRSHIRTSRDLYADISSLWRCIVGEFPHIELKDVPHDERRSSRPAPLTRMQDEISDGLSYLASWSRGSIAAAESVESQIAQTLTRKRVIEAARWVDPDEADFTYRYEIPRWEPEFSSPEERTQWMAQLSRELSKLGVLQKRSTESLGERFAEYD